MVISSITSVMAFTPSRVKISSFEISWKSNVFPSVLVILISASNELYSFSTSSSIPLNPLKTITIAHVLMKIPKTDIPDIILIIFFDFFENKYRFAM